MKMPHMGPPMDPLILNDICKMVGPSCVEIDASNMVNRPKVTADTPKINNKHLGLKTNEPAYTSN